MNEEWFGVCAKGIPDNKGLYELYPRAAYYALRDVHQLKPYKEGQSLQMIDDFFSKIDSKDALNKANGDD